MRILIGHNFYQQQGGEDSVVQTECSLLKDFGEDVQLYKHSNEEIKTYSFLQKLRFFFDLGWQKNTYQELRQTLKKFRPDVAHFHNIFFMLSPSVYQACRDEGVAVVQSFHNFRLLCANGLLFRNNRICEECIEQKSLRRGILYGCYKNSKVGTALIVRMLERHWEKKTWTRLIDAYITATEFGRQKYIVAGMPAEKIFVKPNVYYPTPSEENQDQGYALYVGRLSIEKGLDVLLKAWDLFSEVPLKIIGDGPLRNEVINKTKANRNVEYLGFASKEQYHALMKGAKVVIVPSLCYENFPRIVAEAYTYGIPVLASNVGTLAEIIQDGRTGLLFKINDADHLAEKMRWLAGHPQERLMLQKNIREEYQKKYTGAQNYQQLMTIYRAAIKNKPGSFS